MLGTCPLSPPGGWGSQKPPPGVGIDRTHPLASHLRAAWNFAEGSGSTTQELLDPRHNATFANGTCWKPSARGVGVYFDGSDDYATFWAKDLQIQNPFTVHALVNVTGTGNYGSMFANDLYLGVNSGISWRLSVSGRTPHLVMGTGTGIGSAGTRVLNASSAVAAGWHSLTATITDLSTGAIWVDGVSVATWWNGTGVAPIFYHASGTGKFGMYQSDSNYFAGMMLSAVYMWDVVLPPEQIRRLHVEPFCLFESRFPFTVDALARPLRDGFFATSMPPIRAIA
jgi:hypothetical protein